MRIVRQALVLGCIAQVLAACGCPDDRVPSGIEMTLPTSLGGDAYRVEVCVDSTCEVFDVAQESVTVSPDGQVELELLSVDTLRYTPWRQISPGTHDVAVDVANESGTLAIFDGSVEFDEIDRCHAEDSQATIELVAFE
jgi:hypothetical protein